MGYTIKNTSKAALTRKLNSLNFQKLNRHDHAGYIVIDHGNHEYQVVNYTYGRGTAFDELINAGYAIETLRRDITPDTGLQYESFTVWGKKIYE